MAKQFDTEELELTFSETISQTLIRDRVEDIVESDLEFREAFRNYPAQNVDTNVIEIPVPKDDMGLPGLVGEGDEFPREQEHYGTEKLTFDKYGFEVAFSWESQEDSLINHVSSQVDRQGRKFQEKLNNRAYDILAESNHEGGPAGDADGVMTYQDIMSARRTLKKEHYSPDLLLLDLDASNDLATDTNFIHATDMGDQTLRTGQIGRVAGLDVVEVDSHEIGVDEAPGGFMIDTDWYGYEATRTGMQSEEYTEKRTQTDVYRLWNRIGWLAINPNACVQIDG